MASYQSSVKMLRETLWNRSGSGVSVMVGSGFSRSANKTRFDVDDIPLWNDIANAVAGILYPELENGSGNGLTHPVQTAESALRLGQEFETVFGRAKLHEFLDEVIHDNDFAPGKPHSRLLRLPWRDVFTTNWDTLLERSASDLVERSYSLVQNLCQLPLKSQPRIFKLHGSLTAQFPLIFTEEDYRTYPVRFAPFVNTVQQAMMESLFLLIGFSGDDPNFLKWSGWIRDNLGDSAPKIYLAGWLELSSSRRRMLEVSRIIPIDLAEHPKANEWPEGLRHQYATEWLLHSLEKGQPYDSTTWPSPQNPETATVPGCLQPVDEVDVDVPKTHPEKERQTSSPNYENESLDGVQQVLKAWEYNRRLYPGWLVFPHGQDHFDLSFRTNEWEPQILKVQSRLSPVEQLKAIRELVWLREILLDPITPELEKAAQEILDAIDSVNHSIEGVSKSREDWPEIRDAWRTVSLALITDARYECNREVFEGRIEAILPLLSEDPDAAHRVWQEKCLWAAYSLDLEQLNKFLDEWHVDNCDPAWMLRKAALLTETQRFNESIELLQKALNILRLKHQGGMSIARASRESWALASTITARNHQEVLRDWEKFATQKCDASTEIEHIERTLQVSALKKEAPTFDYVIRENTSIHFSNEGYTRVIAAYRAIRLPEVAGLPTYINPGHAGSLIFPMAASLLTLAADEIVRINAELAIRLVLRNCRNDEDKVLQRVLSRSRIAVLTDETVERLAAICIEAIEFFLPRLFTLGESGGGNSWIERMRVAMEVLSRLVSRLNPELVAASLTLALECYETDNVAQHLWLGPPLGRLIGRSWEALPKEQKHERVFELMNAPVAGLESFEECTNCPDPGTHVSLEDFSTECTPAIDTQYRKTVGFLIHSLASNKTARGRVVLRLMSLVWADCLRDGESMELATALWSKTDPIACNTFSSHSPLDWVFLTLPELECGRAERSFKEKWLTTKHNSQSNESDFSSSVVIQVGAAISGLEGRGRILYLSTEDEQYFVGHIERLVDVYSVGTSRFSLGIGDTIKYIRILASRVAIPSQIAGRLFQKVEDLLRARGDPTKPWSETLVNDGLAVAFAVVPGLVKAMPDRAESISRWLSAGLVSDETARAMGAMLAVQAWLSRAAKEEMIPVPNELIREVGTIVAACRTAALPSALILARQVFEEGLSLQQETLIEPTLRGLSYLADELKYECSQESDADIHTLRLLCTQLAASMAKRGFENNTVVKRWLEIGRTDPFHEIRSVVVESGL